MNIVFIGTIDTRGGAAKISWSLKRELTEKGHQVSMFVGNKYSQDPCVYQIPWYRGQFFLERFFANDLAFPKTDYLVNHPIIQSADIIHCHNLHSSFFNLGTLPKLAQIKPLVWTQHDLWSITGGCTDSHTCSLNKPSRIAYHFGDTRAHLLKTKQQLYQQASFTVVANSQWMLNQLSGSILGDKPLHLVRNGIDTRLFKPIDKKSVRKKLGIPPDAFVVLFAAKGGLRNKLKGSDYFVSLLQNYKNKDIYGICVGSEKTLTEEKSIPWLKIVPFLTESSKMAEHYCAADVFVYPTLADSFGLVAAEAMACGTPVLTFNTDALPELVEHKVNGYVAKYQDADDLLNGLKWIQKLTLSAKKSIAKKSRTKIVDDFSLETMTSNYLQLYEKLLS